MPATPQQRHERRRTTALGSGGRAGGHSAPIARISRRVDDAVKRACPGRWERSRSSHGARLMRSDGVAHGQNAALWTDQRQYQGGPMHALFFVSSRDMHRAFAAGVDRASRPGESKRASRPSLASACACAAGARRRFAQHLHRASLSGRSARSGDRWTCRTWQPCCAPGHIQCCAALINEQPAAQRPFSQSAL